MNRKTPQNRTVDRDKLKAQLIAFGKKKGQITTEELTGLLPPDLVDPKEMNQWEKLLEAEGIEVISKGRAGAAAGAAGAAAGSSRKAMPRRFEQEGEEDEQTQRNVARHVDEHVKARPVLRPRRGDISPQRNPTVAPAAERKQAGVGDQCRVQRGKRKGGCRAGLHTAGLAPFRTA